MGMNNATPQKTVEGFIWLGIKNLAFYTLEFEEFLLKETKNEYNKRASQWIGTCTAPEYLHNADKAFTHEEDYCATLL